MITCFGTITRDILELGGKKEIKLGGAPFFFSKVCKNLNLNYGIVSKIGTIELKENKELFDCRGLQICDETTTLHIKEEEDISCAIISRNTELDITLVPKELLAPDILFLSPLFDEVQPSMFEKKSVLALDLQGFMRDKNKKFLKESWKKKPENLDGLLKHIDILKLNEVESDIIFPGLSVEEKLKRFVEIGPKIVIITLGGKGAAIISENKIFKFTPRKTIITNTVGAGDTFFASFLVTFNKTKDVTESMRFALDYTSDFLEGKK
ncbi:hypothetical protein J4417_01050 [Candidatus Woesearchaeota archaeon]|nr:hypothetical protein [Candidatus Woesearchaeota archaeon]